MNEKVKLFKAYKVSKNCSHCDFWW